MRIGKWVLGHEVEHTGLILGNDAAGKTTMLYQLKLGEVVEVIPTIGFNVETVEYPQGRKATLWDVGGCDQIRPLVRHYVNSDRFIIFLHDCADPYPGRLEFSLEYLHMAVQMMSDAGSRYMWIVFNKQDLLPPSERDTIVNDMRKRYESEVAQYRDKFIIKVMDTPGLSAVTGEQLDVMMNEIIGTLQNEKKKPSRSIPQPKNPALDKGPSDEELREQIRKANAASEEPHGFWESFLEGDLPAWDHFTHLRAGFFVMFDCFAKGSNIFQCADVFMDHLGRLRAKNPERFRNTAHRTMTVFWLVQLQVAAMAYQADQNLDEFPTLEAFVDILLFTPQLMNSGLWRAYYSKDLLFSPAAREDWHLPDLQPLPTIAKRGSTAQRPIKSSSGGDPDRLLKFAFTVIQKAFITKVRRGAVVKQALETLQSSTIRLRAQDTAIPPYSETQAYFWIQFTHAALRFLELKPAAQSKKSRFTGSITALAFPAYKALFGLNGEEWREYYTPASWEAIPSRMSFVNPDKKPLPNVLAIPSHANVELARNRMVNAVNYRLTAPLELPPREEISFIAAILLDESKIMPTEGLNVASHASLLLWLHLRLSQSRTIQGGTKKISTIAAAAASDLSRSIGTTQSMFWVQQILLCMAKSEGDPEFDRFVTENSHLAYEDLPLMYYSPELWYSSEAKEVFMPPDRHASPSIVARRPPHTK